MMRGFLMGLLTTGLLGLNVSVTWANENDSILGYWRTIEDTTGFAKAVVHVQNGEKGAYSATVVATLPRPDYTPAKLCNNCPAPFTDREIIGLPVLWNLRNSDKLGNNNEKLYVDGYVIDPLSGKIYQSEARVSRDGRRLTLRGNVIGMPMIGQGRTQTWLREANYTQKIR
ncbi:MAG: DUF2147 domain-containing protein [Moraxellaceae bacterium]